MMISCGRVKDNSSREKQARDICSQYSYNLRVLYEFHSQGNDVYFYVKLAEYVVTCIHFLTHTNNRDTHVCFGRYGQMDKSALLEGQNKQLFFIYLFSILLVASDLSPGSSNLSLISVTFKSIRIGFSIQFMMRLSAQFIRSK